MSISRSKYLEAKKIIHEYESNLKENESKHVVDLLFTEYGYLKDALSFMEKLCSSHKKTIYCYLKSNNKYVISLSEINNAIPVQVLTYLPIV